MNEEQATKLIWVLRDIAGTLEYIMLGVAAIALAIFIKEK